MHPRTPPPVFELVFQGDIRPEDIPVPTLSHTLNAIHRIGAGPSRRERSEEEKNEVELRSLRLMQIRDGSAIYQFYGPSPEAALHRLEATGRILDNPEDIGENDYILSHIRELSSTARSLGCKIVMRRPGQSESPLAIITGETYNNISKSMFAHGITSIIGKVQRVGNATGARCGLRVPFLDRMLVCKVATTDLARKLGQKLYEDVQVSGEALWLKNTWRIISFTITGVRQPKQGSLDEALEELRRAGGDGWDKIDDPARFIEETTG